MIPKYRRRAIAGLLGSLGLTIVIVAGFLNFDHSEGHRQLWRFAPAGDLAVGLVALYGNYCLVKGKGYSSAVLLAALPFFCLGVTMGAIVGPLVIALAIPDRYPQRSRRSRREH